MRNFWKIETALIIIGIAITPLGRGQELGLETRTSVAAFLDGALPALQPGPTGDWVIVDAFPDLPLEDPDDASFAFEPVYLSGAPRSTTLYLCDKKGKIWSFENSPSVAEKSLVLDISKQVKITPNAGMGGIAFHPDFGLATSPNRGFIYLHYFWSPEAKELGPANQAPDSRDEEALSGYWRLSRFTFQDGQNTIDPESEYILIQQYDPHHWHNGGSLFFDNEGFLYISSGDIGADKNYYKAGQSLTEGLFGTVLRIDVDKDESRSHPIRRQPTDNDNARKTKPKSWTEKSYSQGYYIPNDNPWLDEEGGILEEFWCIGIRSPHRMSYDPPTGHIWVGDVGQFRKEELNFIVKGGNYQWPYKDGTLTGFDRKPSKLIGTDQPPAYEYTHTSHGAAVVGGYVYRGFRHRAELEGKYLFAEHQGGQVWALERDADGKVKVEKLATIKGCGFHNGPSSFGQDNDGELYICMLKRNSSEKAITGGIVKLERSKSTLNPEAPELLSKTGVFKDLANREPTDALIPYTLGAPFWSDAAIKSRYLMIPDGEKITYSGDDSWTFPKGSVFVKHFDYAIDDNAPEKVLPIETRFLIHGKDANYFGLTYRWNDDGTEATLVKDAEVRQLEIATTDGGTRQVKWEYPSRIACMQCHTAAAGHVLGIRSHQLNCNMTYPNGVDSNQLQTLGYIGLFSDNFKGVDLTNLIRSVPISDIEAPLEDRVRSYLDSNCSQCHRPGAVYSGIDARLTTPLEEQGIINGGLIRDYGIEGQAVVRPGNPEISILHRRIHSLGFDMMPPLAKNMIDEQASLVIREWIHSIDPKKWGENSLPPENGPPAAISDRAKVWKEGEIKIDVLANDLDYDDNLAPETLEIVGQSTNNGKAVYDKTEHVVVYTHSGEGNDSFTYRVKDRESKVSNLARVEIELRPITEFDFPEPEPEEPEPIPEPEPDPIPEPPEPEPEPDPIPEPEPEPKIEAASEPEPVPEVKVDVPDPEPRIDEVEESHKAVETDLPLDSETPKMDLLSLVKSDTILYIVPALIVGILIIGLLVMKRQSSE